MGAAASTGGAYLCHRLRLYRLPPIRWPVTESATRDVWLGVWRLLLSQCALAGRRGNGDYPGALPLRLPAGSRLIPGTVGVCAGCGPHAWARPLAAVRQRRRTAGSSGAGGRGITGIDGDA